MIDLVVCPSCSGAGESFVFADGPWGGRAGMERCSRCAGAGRVAAEMLEWIRVGQACRDLRASRGELTRDASERTGLRDTEISAMEMGRVKPDLLALGLLESDVRRQMAASPAAAIRPEIPALARAEDERVSLQESLERLGVTPETLVSDIDRDPGKAVQS